MGATHSLMLQLTLETRACLPALPCGPPLVGSSHLVCSVLFQPVSLASGTPTSDTMLELADTEARHVLLPTVRASGLTGYESTAVQRHAVLSLHSSCSNAVTERKSVRSVRSRVFRQSCFQNLLGITHIFVPYMHCWCLMHIPLFHVAINTHKCTRPKPLQ